ncbi:phosphoglucosamine mutase [Mycoplasmatota bacterium]|nr:phosphoglucosamine mutase [Mycoplasmatota bacterium]
MKKYFGTDGIRGIANQTLTPELAFKLGRVLGHVLKKSSEKINVLIGRDTRISGELLEYSLISGLLSIEANVMRLGVVSTPAVAYLTKSLNAQAGIMISASHNPYPDNGIKIFGSDGYKLMDDVELEIERLIDEPDHLDRPINDKIGVVENYFEGQHKYLSYLQKSIDHTFENMKIAIDCANGATSFLAPHLFANLGADVSLINNTPNGTNINVNCGSTNIESIQQFVLENSVDIGLAFDGDGDRLIVVDEKGQIINGDYILYVLGNYLSEQGKLNDNTLVSTVMSNVGYYKAIEEKGLSSVQTKVGDRYVLEEMLKNKYNLGGEQSGHIIYLDYSSTGDGLLTALQLINIMAEKDVPLSELTKEMKSYPQVLKNVQVLDKASVLDNEELKSKIEVINSELGNNGRVLVRASGTEPLIRVMVEAENDEICEKYVDEIVELIKTLL